MMSTLPTSSADEEQDDESMFETDANAGDPGVTFNSTPISGPVINVLRESIKETGIKSGNDFVFRPQTGVSLAGPYPGRVDPSDCSIDLEFDADDAPAPPVSQAAIPVVETRQAPAPVAPIASTADAAWISNICGILDSQPQKIRDTPKPAHLQRVPSDSIPIAAVQALAPTPTISVNAADQTKRVNTRRRRPPPLLSVPGAPVSPKAPENLGAPTPVPVLNPAITTNTVDQTIIVLNELPEGPISVTKDVLIGLVTTVKKTSESEASIGNRTKQAPPPPIIIPPSPSPAVRAVEQPQSIQPSPSDLKAWVPDGILSPRTGASLLLPQHSSAATPCSAPAQSFQTAEPLRSNDHNTARYSQFSSETAAAQTPPAGVEQTTVIAEGRIEPQPFDPLMMPDNGGQPIPVLSGYGLAPLPSDSAVPSLGGYHYDYTDSLQLKEQKLSEALAVLFSMIEYQPETKKKLLADRWLTPEGMAAIPHLAADLAPLLEKKKVSHRKKETVPKDPEHQADPDAEPEEQPPPKKYTQRTKGSRTPARSSARNPPAPDGDDPQNDPNYGTRAYAPRQNVPKARIETTTVCPPPPIPDIVDRSQPIPYGAYGAAPSGYPTPPPQMYSQNQQMLSEADYANALVGNMPYGSNTPPTANLDNDHMMYGGFGGMPQDVFGMQDQHVDNSTFEVLMPHTEIPQQQQQMANQGLPTPLPVTEEAIPPPEQHVPISFRLTTPVNSRMTGASRFPQGQPNPAGNWNGI